MQLHLNKASRLLSISFTTSATTATNLPRIFTYLEQRPWFSVLSTQITTTNQLNEFKITFSEKSAQTKNEILRIEMSQNQFKNRKCHQRLHATDITVWTSLRA